EARGCVRRVIPRIAAGLDAGCRLVPAGDRRLERVAGASKRDDAVVVGPIERFEALEDVRGLTEGESEVAPLERNVLEADQRTAGGLLRLLPLGIDLDPGQRDARLHAALHIDERDLHVDRRRQLRLRRLQLFELNDLARFRALRTDGAVRHSWIVVARIVGWAGKSGRSMDRVSRPGPPDPPDPRGPS